MGRTIRKHNFRVVVYPEEPRGTRWFIGRGPLSPQEQLDAEDELNALEVQSEIRRHIDGIASVHIESDVDEFCSFCGAVWTEGKSSTNNGGCCDKDYEVYLKEHPEEVE